MQVFEDYFCLEVALQALYGRNGRNGWDLLWWEWFLSIKFAIVMIYLLAIIHQM